MRPERLACTDTPAAGATDRRRHARSLASAACSWHVSARPHRHQSPASAPQVAGFPTVLCRDGVNASFQYSPRTAASSRPKPLNHAAAASGLDLDRILGGKPQRRTAPNTFVTRVVEHCGPAVVRVDTERRRRGRDRAEAELLAQILGLPPKDLAKEEGHASGFCVDHCGLVLTNAHVVWGQDRIFVTFPGLERMEAVLLGADEVLDVASLRVQSRSQMPLPTIPLGNSSLLRVGDWAIALGNPCGLTNSCTLGIVSSLERSTGETGWDWMFHSLIQTDAAVNQGSSGGPLLNEAGEAIGIVSMRALFGEGIAFALPIDGLRRSLRSHIAEGRSPSHAFLGLRVAASSSVSSSARKSRGLEVLNVIRGSPAERAGLRPGDGIEELDGRPLSAREDLQVRVRESRPGDSFALKARRAGKSFVATVSASDVHHLKELQSKARREKGKRELPTRPQPPLFIIP